MTNITFSSRATDLKVLAAVAILGLSALAGNLLPTPINAPHIQLYDALVTVPIWVFVWSLFHLFAPVRPYSPKWQTATLTATPFVWALLVVALGFLLQSMHNESEWLKLNRMSL